MNFNILRVLVCGILALTLLQTSEIASADNDNGPIAVGITPILSSTITIGEPVILHYTITNNSDEEAWVYLGPEEKDWYTEEAIDDSGQKISTLPQPQVSERRGITSNGLTVGPHATLDGYLVTGKSFVLTHPGHYTLIVHLRLPYGIGDQAKGATPDQLINVSGTIFTQDYPISLTVTPYNSARLNTIAERLRAGVTNDKNGEITQSLVVALFSIPVSAALTTWQKIATDPSLPVVARSQVAHELSRIPSLEAANLLAGMIWNPAQPYSVASVSNVDAGLLQDMYRSGSPTLRQHVRDLLAEHGLVASDAPDRSPFQD